jgi:hypothetical protein
MLFRLASLGILCNCVVASVDETWKKADAAIEQVQKKFADIKEHAQEVEKSIEEDKKEEATRVSQSEEEVKRSKAIEIESEKVLEENAKKALVKQKEIDSSFLQLPESSFMELPDSLEKFPKVAEDMERLKEAEKVYNQKMKALHQQDDELLAMANKDFEDSRKSAELIGNLRAQHRKEATSFVQKDDDLPAAFQRILQAEADLQKVNQQIARDFNLA